MYYRIGSLENPVYYGRLLPVDSDRTYPSVKGSKFPFFRENETFAEGADINDYIGRSVGFMQTLYGNMGRNAVQYLSHSIKGSTHDMGYSLSPIRILYRLEKNLDGTLIFWLAALFGTLGIHCILSKRYLRGYAYLFVAHWDILIKMFCPSLWRIMPYWVPVIIFFCNLVITVFCLKDVYAISKGCYDNVKNKQLYKSKTWMKSCFVFAIVFHIVLLCNYLMYVVSAFTSM